MAYDVVCAGAVYLDLTFEGLDRAPAPGEERWADDLTVSPGGMANTAIGLNRLGLRTAIAWPLGRDVNGRYLRSMLESEGVTCAGASTARSAVTAVIPLAGDRAMISYEPAHDGSAEVIAGLAPRAVIALIDQIHLAPAGTRTYATTSHAHVGGARATTRSALTRVHALIANEQEALGLSGQADAAAAACALAATATTAVVTLGARGALAASGGRIEHVAAPAVDVRDVTGAGDLFAAAYVWADLLGLPLPERLAWATLYATLSLRRVTAFAGAVTLAELFDAGQAGGLVPPHVPDRVTPRARTRTVD